MLSTAPLRHRPQLLEGEELPPLPQQERSRAKRDALLIAGLELFQECGYEAATVEEVAHRAGVAVGGFYQHFRSKRQLLLVLVDCLLEEISRIDLEQILTAESDPRAVLDQLVQLSLSLDSAYVGAHRAWREASVYEPGLAGVNEQIEDWTASLAHTVMEGLSRLPGARPDLDLKTLSWIITQLFWKVSSRMAAGHETYEREAVARSLVHLMYHALFADSSGYGR